MANKVGVLIKEARTGAGLTQEQLARKIKGISADDISKAERGEKELTQAHNVIQHFIYSQNHSTHVKFNKAPESNKVTYIPSDSLIPEPFMLLLSRTNEKRQATTVQSRPVFPQTAPRVKLPCALTSI